MLLYGTLGSKDPVGDNRTGCWGRDGNAIHYCHGHHEWNGQKGRGLWMLEMGKPAAWVVVGDLDVDGLLTQHRGHRGTVADHGGHGPHVHFTEYSSPSAWVIAMLVTFLKVTSLGNMDHHGGDPCTPTVLFEFLPVISSGGCSWAAAHDEQLWFCANCYVWDSVLDTEWTSEVTVEPQESLLLLFLFLTLTSLHSFPPASPPTTHTFREQWNKSKRGKKWNQAGSEASLTRRNSTNLLILLEVRACVL